MSLPIDRPEQAQLIDIILPELGSGVIRVSLWFARPGDWLYQGDRIVEVIMGGATFDVPAPATGRLVEQWVFPSDIVRAGQVLGAVEAEAED